jgi:hypothetical protein
MKTKAVILNLRVARRNDFSDELGQKKYGCMYFQQSIKGTFCNQPYFFHENTNMEVFKELYSSSQIWVLAGIFDEVEIIVRHKPIKTKPAIKKNRPCFCNRKINK